MQNILITGGGSGIGRVTARLFLERGWRVGLIGRRQDALEETAAKNPNALVLSCDVTDPQAVDAAGNVGGSSEVVVAVVPDTVAPSTPAGLAVTLRAGQPLLSWRASTDAVGVAGYDVLRNGVAVGTVTGLSFSAHA